MRPVASIGFGWGLGAIVARQFTTRINRVHQAIEEYKFGDIIHLDNTYLNTHEDSEFSYPIPKYFAAFPPVPCLLLSSDFDKGSPP